jgi:phosphoribosylglycinamide formyltransferase 1
MIYMDKEIADRHGLNSGPRVAVLASGAGTTFAHLVAASRDGSLDATIQLLVASRDDVRALAKADHLRVARVVLDANKIGADRADGALLTLLRARSIDLVVLAGYLRKLGPRTLTAYSGRIINTHPAPLPRFGGKGMYGSHVHQAVLDAGVPASAATIHLVDAEYDTGPVIAEAPVPVLADDTVDSLQSRVQAAERELLLRTIPSLRSRL